jgi:hypothetical protein
MPNLSVKWNRYSKPINLATTQIFLWSVKGESLKQLVQETVKPIPTQPGQLERYDYCYERNGTANIFMLCNPIEGRRQVKVTQRRTAIDYAHLLKELVDVHYPEALLITVIQDQLNTHSFSSLYKAFPPAEARRILNRLQFCYILGKKSDKYGQPF